MSTCLGIEANGEIVSFIRKIALVSRRIDINILCMYLRPIIVHYTLLTYFRFVLVDSVISRAHYCPFRSIIDAIHKCRKNTVNYNIITFIHGVAVALHVSVLDIHGS
jgi:hypothetical protein